jgi:hypothetical protein
MKFQIIVLGVTQNTVRTLHMKLNHHKTTNGITELFDTKSGMRT